MPDMVTRKTSVVVFTTPSDDFRALVRGPGNTSVRLKNGGRVPTSQPGFFTVIVADRQLRSIAATLTDKASNKRSVPVTVTRNAKELVILAYQVL